MNELDLYGPPGTGKTTRLTEIALKSVNTVGPERLAAVTYTRAAALELRGRIAASLGIQIPESPKAARSVLDRTIPWVGTIHSLCYKLIGRPPLVSGSDLTTFAKAIDPHRLHEVHASTNPEEVEGYEFGDVSSKDEVELALQLHAMARHRLIEFESAVQFLSDRARVEVNVDRLHYIADQYEAFKTDMNKIDFEDMLMLGADMDIPVSVMLCDEVQDNSALLWRTIDAWASRNADLVVMAGDPWQAIYIYSGASPDLFRKRQGKWITIGDSYRLSAPTAAYALSLLRRAGYENDSLLSTWEGVGGTPKDSTSFYLARTNNLLLDIRADLESRGEPYRLLRGTGPLQMKAAKAFRAFKKDMNNEGITAGTAALVADVLPPKSGVLPYGKAATWTRLASEQSHTILTQEDRILAENAAERMPNYDYYEHVLMRYGSAGFILEPKISVGTIHAAKGREADEVSVVRSWGWLPGRAVMEGRGLEEACVAYVAATRHRTRFSLIEGSPGINYPWGPLPILNGESPDVD